VSDITLYAKSLAGLSYRIERQGDHDLLLSRTAPSGLRDVIYLRARSSDPSDTEWGQHLSSFEKEKRDQPKGKRILVYPPTSVVDAGSVADSRRVGFELLTTPEFLDRFANLGDLSQRIRERLEGTTPPEREEWNTLTRTYTPQQIVVGETLEDSANSFILDNWTRRPGAQVLVLLAPAGHGKTALTKFIASTLLKGYRESGSAPLPILIPFANYRRLVTFRALILEFFDDHRHPIAMDTFNILLSSGRLLLILDGFDELCEQAGLATARENLRAFAEGISSGGKFVLTSRTIFYRTNIEGASLISDVIDDGNVTLAELQPFDDVKQRRFLQKLSPNERVVTRILQVLKDVPLVKELAGSPFLLRELHDIFASSEHATYNGAGKTSDLYDWMLARLCERERERQNYDLSNDQQIEFLESVANWIFTDTPASTSTTLGLETGAVQFMVEYIFDDVIRAAADSDRKKAELIAKLTHHAILNAVGGQIDRVQFIHHTWKDFLVSKQLDQKIRRAMATRDWEEVANTLSTRPLPEWVGAFLASALDEPTLKTLCQDAPRLRDPRIFPKILSIALAHAELLEPTDAERRAQAFLRVLGGYTFKGKLLSSIRFSHLDLSGQPFAQAEIRDGQFLESTLRNASFRSSILTHVVFEACDLRGADFSQSKLSNVTFPDCDVEATAFHGSTGLSKADRQRLSDGGAIVDMTDLSPRQSLSPREAVASLVRTVLGKFRYDASKMQSALARGIPLGQRNFVDNSVVRRLVNADYLTLIDRGKATPVIVKRIDKRNPEVWRFVDSGEESPEIAGVVDALVRDYAG
jgi:hypothetical protein